MVTAAMAAALSKAGTYDNGAGLLLAAREHRMPTPQPLLLLLLLALLPLLALPACPPSTRQSTQRSCHR